MMGNRFILTMMESPYTGSSMTLARVYIYSIVLLTYHVPRLVVCLTRRYGFDIIKVKDFDIKCFIWVEDLLIRR
jgi:hypothetical protein